MSSQVKLTLRPPPNVEFVQGYPGIPPGAPDRPQAAVKGTIEVRVGPQGCKAKWVRIELKKVETLPGGGQANTFFDFVGPSPVNLWQAQNEEYSLLPTQDFPFYIRIPESIPPSISLEKGAGIKYELVATVCLKGKKGFLRRGKPIIQSTQTTINLDKHELHSTWPVYCQPESRRLDQEGVSLTINRTHTCYGPGDKVVISATIKSDSLHTVILRGFEFALKETTIYRAGPYATGKRSAPQSKVTVIGEQKVPVNSTLYGGSFHKAELGCMIPSNHLTTSLNAARHIDITYVLNVKALMGTGAHLIMDLPVIISNWPRNVSVEAIRRIGTAPSLSLGSAINPSAAPNGRMSQTPAGMSEKQRNGYTYQNTEQNSNRFESVNDFGQLPVKNNPQPQPNTMPTGRPLLDEFAYGRDIKVAPATTAGRETVYPSEEILDKPAELRSNSRRPSSANAQANRFTITNIADSDHELLTSAAAVAASAPSTNSHSRSSSARAQFLPAEEEKKRLYEKAMADVARVQGNAALKPSTNATPPRSASPPAPVTSPTSARAGGSGSGSGSGSGLQRNGAWPTAEQEKLALYEQALANVNKAQGSIQDYGNFSPPVKQNSFSASVRSPHVKEPSEQNASGSHYRSPSMSQASSVTPTVSAGAALYQSAMANVNRKQAESSLPSPPPSRGGRTEPVKTAVPAYPSAEEEKAALRRYEEARNAVDRVHGAQSPPASGPVPYESLYPNPHAPSRSGSYSVSTPSNMMPGAYSPMPQVMPQTGDPMSEKERLRQNYEAQDAAAMGQQSPAYQTPPASYMVPSYFPGPPDSGSGLPEKEILRRQYEAQDNGAMSDGNGYTPVAPLTPPARRPSSSSRQYPPQAAPIAGGSNILSAVEEKALLRARYEAEEQASQSSGSPPPSFGQIPIRPNKSFVAPPAPPPLMPKPPVEYIQETQEEDARVRDGVAEHDIEIPTNQNAVHGLDLRPFTPFSIGLGGVSDPPPAPPPLPPKRFNSSE